SSKKAKKDPNAPKHFLTSYIHFSREARPKVEKENPKLTPNEVVAEVAKKWNALSDKEKQKYKDIAKKDRDRYDKELEAYNKKKENEGS
ncbi:high mobility group box domain-containing protein, partial [Cunninghamella echinulata]